MSYIDKEDTQAPEQIVCYPFSFSPNYVPIMTSNMSTIQACNKAGTNDADTIANSIEIMKLDSKYIYKDPNIAWGSINRSELDNTMMHFNFSKYYNDKKEPNYYEGYSKDEECREILDNKTYYENAISCE